MRAPTIEDRQGNDIGAQYQTGIYWNASDTAFGEAIRDVVADEQTRVEAEGKAFCVEVKELSNFFGAEEYHQSYLIKNPGGYCHVSRAEMDEVLRAFA